MMKKFSAHDIANRHVKKLQAYRVTSQEVWKQNGYQELVKADWNEAGSPPSPKVLAALEDFLANKPLHWYPDVEATSLRRALAGYTGRPTETIQVFGGSDAALEYLCRAFLDSGDEVIIRTPTYDNFRVYAESSGAKVVAVSNPSPFVLDVQAVIDAIGPKTKVVYLVNPDNPTGVTYYEKDITAIAKAAPNALIVSDEAYYEFHGHSATGLLDRFPNLVISRSFSKAFALAGFRIGYLVASEEILAVINKIRVGKNVNSFAQLAAEIALSDLDHLKSHVAEVDSSREFLVRELRARGLTVYPTIANFIMVQIDNPTAFASHLKNEQIFIRDRSYLPQLEGFVRITVGSRSQAERIIAASDRYLELGMIGL